MKFALTVASIIIAALLSASCSSTSSTAPSTVTVTQSPAALPTATAAPSTNAVQDAASAQITLPDVAGRNAEIVRKELEKLGLTDVNLSSANPKYSVVVLASNWTAVSIEPEPGTLVNADDPVVVKVTKP